MNNFTGLGRIIKDIDCKTLQNGKCVSNFTIACTRGFKNAEGKYDADFIPCTAFGKTAEIVGNYFAKGQRILVMGRIDTSSYEKNGQKQFFTKVVVDKVEFVEKKDSNKGGGFGDMGTPQADAGGFGG